MEAKAPTPAGKDSVDYDVSVVGSPEVFGGEHSSPGETKTEPNERAIEKRDQSPKSQDVIIIERGEVQREIDIHEQLKMWQWVFIDGIQLPALARGTQLFLAVHNVQLRLLSRFPPGLSKDILNRYTMVSHRMTPMEAWTLNSINAVIRKYELGCQLFTPEDEIVLLRDVELFYWNIKAINLNHMVLRYDEEIKKAHNNIALMAVATSIKQHVEMELEECKTNIQRVDNEFASALPFVNLEQVQAQAAAAAAAEAKAQSSEGKTDVNVFS